MNNIDIEGNALHPGDIVLYHDHRQNQLNRGFIIKPLRVTFLVQPCQQGLEATPRDSSDLLLRNTRYRGQNLSLLMTLLVH